MDNSAPFGSLSVQGQTPLQLAPPASHLAIQELVYVMPSTPQTGYSTSPQSQGSAQSRTNTSKRVQIKQIYTLLPREELKLDTSIL